MNFSQPGIFQRSNERWLEYARRHRDLTACALLATAYLVVCVFLRLPYYYVCLGIVGVIALGISLKYPFTAFLGYIFLVNFLPYGYIESNTFTLAKIGGVLLVAVTLAVTAIRTPEYGQRLKRAFDKRGIVVLILIAAGAFSTIISHNPQSAFVEQHFQFLVLFVLTRVYVDTEKRLWWLLVIILLARGMDGALGLYQYITVPEAGRIAGNFLDPNEYACYSVVALPIAVYLAQYRKSKVTWAFFIALGLLTFIAVIISFSRAGFVTLALILLVIFFIPVIKLRNRLILLLLTVVLIIAFIPFEYWSRIETLNSLFGDEGTDQSVIIRKRQVDTSIRLFLENPILGVGYMRYRTAPEKLLGGYIIKRGRTGEHSTMLQVLVEFGLIGFIPFVVLIILSFWSGIRAVKLAKLAGDQGIRLLSTATTLSFTSFIIFSFMLGTYTKYLYLYLVLPMVAYDIAIEKLSGPLAEREVLRRGHR
ncbi:MAG TPA: O-antigen ligase family protein [bacterium]|nr:O-antigen ligase family protein [bacterium]